MNIKELLKTRLCEEMNFRGDGYLIMEQVIEEVFGTYKDGNVPEANAQPQLAEVLTEMLHEAIGLLMNYEQRCEMDWIEDNEELIAKYNEHFS